MQAEEAEGRGEVVGFAEKAGRGLYVGEVVREDGSSGREVFGFSKTVRECTRELMQFGGVQGDEGCRGKGFLPEIGKTIGFRGGGVVGEIFVGFGESEHTGICSRDKGKLPIPASRN